jgi:hypothetical protein
LFRNDLEVLPTGERRLRFTDVTEQARLTFSDYGMGAAAADFDKRRVGGSAGDDVRAESACCETKAMGPSMT